MEKLINTPVLSWLKCVFCNASWSGFFPDGLSSSKVQCPHCLKMSDYRVACFYRTIKDNDTNDNLE